MSVYLDGSSVLLDSGSVATDTGCCCGGCTGCICTESPPCMDGDGNCWTVLECDGTCGGTMVACDSLWANNHAVCCNQFESCNVCGVECDSGTDLDTCDAYNTCDASGFPPECMGFFCGFGCSAQQTVSNQCTQCPCDCSPGVSVTIDVNATAGGTGCATMNVTDSLSFSQGAGFGFYDFTTVHDCLAGCTFSSDIETRVSYIGTVTCSGAGVMTLFIGAIGACCYEPLHLPCDSGSFNGCNCGAPGIGPEVITCSGVYHYSSSGCGGLSTCTIDVTVTVTIP